MARLASLLSLLLPTMINADVTGIRPRVYTFHGTEPNRTLSTKAWNREGARQQFRDHISLVTPVERDRIHGWITT
jgi:hypothetical protein